MATPTPTRHNGKPHAGGAVRTCDLCKKIADDIVRALALGRALARVS